MFEELNRLLSQSVSENSSEPYSLRLHEGERRIVTILFADVKGFTSLSERMDPEQIHVIMDKLMQLFTVCIKNFGGFVDKYEGDKIMALFGAREASERDTERALMAALEMLEKLELFNEILASENDSKEIRMDIRIGVNTGLVIAGRVGEKREGDFTVYGDAVNLASRMEENAPDNSIMIPMEISDLVKDRFLLKTNGTLRIKGKSDPVEVFLVEGRRKTDVMRREEWKFPFIGRKDELKILSSKYGLLKDPSRINLIPTVIAVRGQAGIGKTRLVSRFIRTILVENGEGTVRHASVPPFAQIPYCLFTELVSSYSGMESGDPRETVRRKLDRAMTSLLNSISPDSAERLRRALPMLGYLFGLDCDDPRLQHDPKVLKDHVMLALRHFLESVALEAELRGNHLVLVLEDLHWIDEASMSVLEHLLKTLNYERHRDGGTSCRMLIILTFRPEFELPDSWKSVTDLTELFLEPLSDDECNELLNSSMGDTSLLSGRRRELLKKSEGNPFFLEEWIKLLQSADEPDALNTLKVPDTLTSLMLSRIDRLEKDVRLLLQKASVNGMDFTRQLLCYIEEQLNRLGVIDGQLEQLLDEGLVSPVSDDVYSFSHAITRDVSYNTLLKANRKILHRLIGEFLEARSSDRSEEIYPLLAHHFHLADEKDRAISYLKLAARDAEEKFDLRNAVEHLEKLGDIYRGMLQRAEDDSKRQYTTELIRTMLGRGSLLESMGSWDRCSQIYDEALELCEEISDRHLEALVMSGVGVIQWRRGKMDQALETVSKAMEVLEEYGDEEALIKAVLNRGNINLQQGDYDMAVDCYRKVSDYYLHTNPNQHLYSLYIGNMGIAYMYKQMFDDAGDCYRKQLEICEKLGDRPGIATVTINLGELFRSMGDADKALEYFNRSRRMFEETGIRSRGAVALGNIGTIQYTKGDFSGALESYLKAIDILRSTGDKFYSTLYEGNTGTAYLQLRDHEKAEERFARAVEDTIAMNSQHLLMYWLQYRAENYYYMGRFRDAVKTGRKAVAISEELGNQQTRTFASIDLHRSLFQLAEDDEKKMEEGIQPLLRMLEGTDSPDHEALIGRALTDMYRQLEDREAYDHYRSMTLDICKELDDEQDYFQWKQILRELEG